MTDAVTYADLRFGDIQLQETKHGGSAPEDHNEDDMYENFPGLQPPREERPPPAPAMGRGGQLKAGLQKRSLHLSLVLLMLCLVVSGAVISLAVKYVQVSGDLQQSVTNHQTVSSGMAQSLRSGEELLESVRRELMATKTELEKVVQDNKYLNSSLLQCWRDEEKSTADRQEAEETLRDTVTKLDKNQKDFCPEGWILFGKKCFWFSVGSKTWQNSKEDCESKNSKLIVVQQNDAELKDFLKGEGEFWVGKEITWKSTPEWKWPNGYQSWNSESCWHINGVNLQGVSCERSIRWICEKNLVLTAPKNYYSTRYTYWILEFALENEELYCYKMRNT